LHPSSFVICGRLVDDSSHAPGPADWHQLVVLKEIAAGLPQCWINMGCIKNQRVLAVLSGVIGALIGAFISLVVDSSLFEISVNGFFSFVFGVSLMLIGAMILFRVLPQPGQSINAVRMFIIGFSILVIFSGLFCFFLERDWITVLKPNAKIPMYIVLGTSLCFALTFSIVDLVNQGWPPSACSFFS
jgi:hypothetical protein